MTSSVMTTCDICGESAAEPQLFSECIICSRTFHLNPYNNDEHKDCGDAIIGESEGIEFWCGSCLEELHKNVSAQPVDPREALEELAAPSELYPRRAPAPAAQSAPTPEPSREAPPRRERSTPRKRYRRIDS